MVVIICSPLSSHAEDVEHITKYLVEGKMRVSIGNSGTWSYLPIADMPELPAKILKRDRQRLTIVLKDEQKGVINVGDVRITNEPDIVKICQITTAQRNSDSREYGLRGVGEDCK
ncbi:hypothetical protein [Endozoicomonas ascidiicola]|uniref:hypothetical protein n=1 Tax=Endozoicomonas ascidiicola TaxID=1698521 RepID=UPI0012FE3053|nr:hypothetical protein [Endozoicomonas ascidiicola]